MIIFFHITHSLFYVSLSWFCCCCDCFEFQQCCYWWRCCCCLLISIYFSSGTQLCVCVCVCFLCHKVSKAIPSSIGHHNSIRCALVSLCPCPYTSFRLYSLFSFSVHNDVRRVCVWSQAPSNRHNLCTRNGLKCLITKTNRQPPSIFSLTSGYGLKGQKSIQHNDENDCMQKNGEKRTEKRIVLLLFLLVLYFFHPVNYTFSFIQFSGLHWKVNNRVFWARHFV